MHRSSSNVLVCVQWQGDHDKKNVDKQKKHWPIGDMQLKWQKMAKRKRALFSTNQLTFMTSNHAFREATFVSLMAEFLFYFCSLHTANDLRL